MLQTGSPQHNERQRPRSVSPMSSHHVSTSFNSTPHLSSLDGPLRNLDTLPLLSGPRRSRSTSALDMAIKPARVPKTGHQDSEPTLKPSPKRADEALEAGPVILEEPSHLPLNEELPVESFPSLYHLSENLRLERDQRRDCIHLQDRLRQAHVVAARTCRLLHIARSVQRTLGECITAEDKHSFVNLYNAFQDTVSGCLDVPSLLEPSIQSYAKDFVDYPVSFVDSLPDSSRAALLEFISKVKCDAGFIADRLVRLTPHELVKLLPGKAQSKSSESIFGHSSRASSRTSRHLGFVADGQTELLTSLEYGSTLDTMVHAVRGLTSYPLFRDDSTTDVWATVCASLVKDQRQGSEKFVPALIDMWAASSPWQGKERLALWISETVQKGSPLLEQSSRQSFRVRAGGQADHDSQDEHRAEAFYSDSVLGFLALLADSDGLSVIPEGARAFCHAICKKLDAFPYQRVAFANFVLIRWLSASFLTDAITLPEASLEERNIGIFADQVQVNGILGDHFISDNARQRILREISNRCQKAIFDVVYFWKYGQKSSPNLISAVHKVAERFEPESNPPQASIRTNGRTSSSHNSEPPIPLCAADVRTLVHALYPSRSYGSISSEVDGARNGLQSSSSSISGFSLFQSPTVPLTVVPASTVLQDNGKGQLSQPSIFADQDSILDSEKADSDQDGDFLREACNTLEDGFAGRSLPGYPDWAVLMFNPSSQELLTVRDALSRGLASTQTHNHEPTDIVSDSYRCRDAVREVLFQTSLYPEPSTDEHGHHQRIQTSILHFFHKQISLCEDSSDFVAAHTWCRRLDQFEAYQTANPNPGSLSQILSNIGTCSERGIESALMAVQWCIKPLQDLKHLMDKQHADLMTRADSLSRLRTKMWYVAEVRTSAAYDEARSVAAALKVMGKSKRPRRSRPSPPLRHSNGPKVSSTSFHLKTEAQVLEILGASPDHGGPNKLSDDQARILATWMDRNGIENLCTGEERLQRLCMEIRKAVSTLTADASTAWSSSLFARDQLSVSNQPKYSPSSPLWPHHGYATRFDPLTLQTNMSPSIDSVSSAASHPLSARSSRDYLDTRSPALTNKSSAPFWSPAMTETRSPSSTTSIGSSNTRGPGMYHQRQSSSANQISVETLKDEIRQHATSLLLSDLTLSTFANGSETDQAFWSGLGGELVEKHFCSSQPIPSSLHNDAKRQIFDLDKASRKLMQLFTATSNPITKLRYLCDLDTLFRSSVAPEQTHTVHPSSEALAHSGGGPLRQSNGAPRVSQSRVSGFRKLFSDSTRRPSTIFRDLQYIAAFMPPTMTLSTPEGKAFRHAAIALLGIKQEACRIMVETADSIIEFHSNKRGSGGISSTAQRERDSATFSAPSRTPPAEDICNYTMAQAAELLQITAKEGDAAAQRELATLYLTHPELMDHIIAPLSRPRDVFKEELESKWRKNQDPSRCDPATMCVAHHWMSLSSKGGDALAKEYLRQREEMDQLG